jgi:hypothetical protein
MIEVGASITSVSFGEGAYPCNVAATAMLVISKQMARKNFLLLRR